MEGGSKQDNEEEVENAGKGKYREIGEGGRV